MQYSLNQATRDAFFPNILPLTDDERDIFNDHEQLFHRMGTHWFSEELKRDPKVRSEKWCSHIPYKMHTFLKMMTALEKPDNDEDPVEIYGWRRDEHGDLIRSLQSQYALITQKCYAVGFKKHCIEWEDYLATPVYWYKTYAAYLVSDEHTARWLQNTMDRGSKKKTEMTLKEELMGWANKLIMLRNAFPLPSAHEFDDCQPTNVIDYLSGCQNEYLAYARRIDNRLVEDINKVGQFSVLLAAATM